MFEDVFKDMPQNLVRQRALMPRGTRMSTVANMNMIQALNSAMDVMLGKDPAVIIMGEDIGYFGGVFRATEGFAAQVRRTSRHRYADRPKVESSPPPSAWV